MIGRLPVSLEVGGKNYEINTDFRIALLIFEAYNDPDLSNYEKNCVCLECLYNTVPDNVDEALKKAVWYLDGGDTPKSRQSPVKIMDWEYDQSIIFPAVNKVAGYETRSVKYLHWWSFLGLFGEVGDGLFAQVMSIRAKLAKGKKLEKWEREFYHEHKELINIKAKPTEEDKKEEEFINNLI